jgi:hypothetical protein
VRLWCALVIVIAIAARARADGGAQLDPRVPETAQALRAERFALPTNPDPGRLGSRYLRVAMDFWWACRARPGHDDGEISVVLFDTSAGQRIDTKLPCPANRTGLRLVWYAPDHHRLGWYYTQRTDHNPYTFDGDRDRFLDHEARARVDQAYYVEQDLESGHLDPPVRLFESTGMIDLYGQVKIELASDDHTIDVIFHEHRDKPFVRVMRFDLVANTVESVAAMESASDLDGYWDAGHDWIALAGWIDKFESAIEPGQVVFLAPAKHARFTVPTSGSVNAITFDSAHGAAYVGSPASGEIWRVDLGKQRVGARHAGFGEIGNILLAPDRNRFAILLGVGEYVTAGKQLDHPQRHPYEPLLGDTAPFPWQYAMVSSVDDRYAIYTSLGKVGAILQWR